MDGIKMFLLLILTVAIPRSIEAADVTTVYKFNTLRSDNPTLQYLNTCSVSVYMQDNDQGLPLFENHHGNSFYRWIPPLYNYTSGGSEWQFKTNTGTLGFIFPFNLNIIFPTNVNSNELFRKMSMAILPCSRILAEKLTNTNGYVSDNTNDLNEGSTFVGVTFTRKTAQIQGIQLRIIYYTTAPNEDMFTYIFVTGTLISVCCNNPFVANSCSNDYTYGENEDGIMHDTITVYMSVNSERVILIVASDSTIYKVHFTDMHIPPKFGKPIKVCHRYIYSKTYGDQVSYKVVQLNSNENSMMLVSPLLDLKRDSTALFMLVYVLKNDSKLSHETLINAHIDEVATVNWKLQFGKSNQLKYQEVNQATIMNYSDQKSNDSPFKRVLLKINVRNPDNWKGLKQIRIKMNQPLMFIANIWEGRDEHKVNISNKTNCWNSDKNVMYSTPAIKSSNNASLSSQYSSCYNGGHLHASYCVCPPGFIGNQCETPCGRNLFGSNCSIICSRSSSECQGMVFCTPMYGCSCYPGYYGAQCTQKCEEGFYGANCKQPCSQGCESGCDNNSGNCRGSCKTPYLIGPKCDEFPSYLRDPPMVVDSNFTSVHLSINLSTSNIIKPLNYHNSPMFYIVQYREETNKTWINCSRGIFIGQIESYVVDGLKPGHIYFFKVLLVDSTMKTHDPNIAKISKGNTKCNSDQDGSVKATEITNTSVYLTWKPEQGNECPAISYILVIEEDVDDFLEISQINNISRTFYEIKDLVPSQLYRINLKKITLHGESDPIASIKVTTDDTIDFTREIPGVTMIRDYNRVVLKWYASAIYKTFYVKYILNRHLSCSNDDVYYPLVVHVTKETTFSLSDENLEPYSHYYIFVTPDVRRNLNFNNFTFTTGSTLPTVTPNLLENKMKVTTESIHLYVANASSCEGMNGVFLKYFISYYNNYSKSMHMFETVDNPIVLMNLHPSTEYFAKIYYVNNIGYNKDKYLEYNFTTKSTIVLVAKELTAYKTSADLIGLRWKLPETNLTITGSNIGLHTDIWNKTISFESGLDTMKCRAWPSYICFDITDLRPNVKYNITVDLLSNESSEIGSSNPISAITKEGIASPVENLKMEKIFQTNITISWKIPYMLNGILRKFVIEVEHLSSFNEALCCENLLVLNHEVSGEQEEYSHVLSNVHSASSYHITIRPFTKRLGSPLSKIVETPPPLQSLKYMPLVKLNNRNVEFIEIDDADSSGTDHELVNDILILVQELSHGSESNGNLGHLGFRREISQILKSNSWWLTHVCIPSEENCSIDLGVTPEESEDPKYGMVVKKQLLVGQEYRVIIVQVNQYMSARSYTIAQSNKLTIGDG